MWRAFEIQPIDTQHKAKQQAVEKRVGQRPARNRWSMEWSSPRQLLPARLGDEYDDYNDNDDDDDDDDEAETLGLLS